jgi:hypothetical protein
MCSIKRILTQPSALDNCTDYPAQMVTNTWHTLDIPPGFTQVNTLVSIT